MLVTDLKVVFILQSISLHGAATMIIIVFINEIKNDWILNDSASRADIRHSKWRITPDCSSQRGWHRKQTWLMSEADEEKRSQAVMETTSSSSQPL